MHFLITGHTGFKGSWLVLMLSKLGHTVSGVSLPPEKGSLFEAANLAPLLRHHVLLDIRDRSGLKDTIRDINPDVVIHMAAQPLVLRSYEDPEETFDINVNGTLNLIEACKNANKVRAVLIVTTDKVYRDSGKGSYSESDPLGGFDPYSASKAMADLLAQSQANLSLNFRVGIARAGNVIGAGDASANRMIPDIVSAIKFDRELVLRMPTAVRPWQHVLDCLNGYIKFTYALMQEEIDSGALVLNIGPDPASYRSVLQLVEQAKSIHPELGWRIDSENRPKETSFLTLDSTVARKKLGWTDKLDFETAVSWSLASLSGSTLREILDGQIEEFMSFETTGDPKIQLA